MYNKSNHYYMTQFQSASCVIYVNFIIRGDDLIWDAEHQATQLFCLFHGHIKTRALFSYPLPETYSFSDFFTFVDLPTSLASVFVFSYNDLHSHLIERLYEFY